jgi:hypothetical protein
MCKNYLHEKVLIQFAGNENQTKYISAVCKRSNMFLNVKEGSSDTVKSSGLCTGKGEVVVLN